MIHGSSVTRGYKGMRSGISLVEMLIAIVLFGVISAIGYKYYKNFYDTTLAAKKARVAAIVDQATQISNAYDVYSMQMGTAPAAIADLSDPAVRILTATPDPILEITAVANGWELASVDLDSSAGGANDKILRYQVTTATGTNTDKLDYCNILNNVAYPTWDLDTTDANIGTAATMYDGTNPSTLTFTSMMCYRTGANTYVFGFVKTVDPS